MAIALFYSLQNLWPFSIFRVDDLRVSDRIVHKLRLPENTKRFIFAIREPESQSVIYILSAQNLSERSVVDAELLIREVRPDAVVAQVGNSAVIEIQSGDGKSIDDIDHPVPTSSFEVLKRCFIDKFNKEKYENIAGKLVLREIFGVSFHGHVLAAKKAAEAVGSSFMVLELSAVRNYVENNSPGEIETGSKLKGLVSSLIPQKVGSVVLSSTRRFNITDDIQSKMVKLFSSHIESSALKLRPLGSDLDVGLKEIQPRSSYEAPPFAQSIYPLLEELHDIFVDLPSIGRAFGLVQNMLYDVNRGKAVDTRIISEIYTFRVAVEGLRIALNSVGRLPISKDHKSGEFKFPELSVEDKSYVLLAQALQSQAKKFKTTVAIVDASALAGLRRYWKTSVPPEVKDLVGELVTTYEGGWDVANSSDRQWLLSSKPVLAVGAGATAVLGASSFTKVVPASTFMKVLTFNVPASFKVMLMQSQKAMAMVLSKILGPSKVVAPGLAKSGVNATSAWKAAASAGKFRTVAHSVIASAEKTSFSATRTAFYEIMRKRGVRPIGSLPWATLGCSMATCAGLLVYGDGIECAAESFPAAPSIASLGRGIESLRQASETLRQTDGDRIQNSIESLMYILKKVKVQ